MGADLGKNDHGVHASERGEDGGTVLLQDEGSPGTFEFADGTIAIKPDDEQIAKLSGALEVTHVAEVEQVETAVGGDDALAAAARGGGPPRGLPQR
jgi:hypothetical protein